MKLHFTKATDKFTLRLNIEEDHMKLFMDAAPVGGGQDIARKEMLEVLKEAVDVERLDLGVIDDILRSLKEGKAAEDRRILKGTPAQDGTDGKLLLLKKKFSGEVDISTDKSGYVNYKELHLFDNIAKGDIVGRIYPPNKGVDGLDVLNKVVAAKTGKPIKVTADKTITVKASPDANHNYEILVAESDGYLLQEGAKLSIKPEFVVSGDLDLKYGNLDFIGTLRVTGDVVPDVTLQARQGIIVQGSLNGASLISTEGGISVKGFYYGGPQSKVTCPKNFEASVVHNLNAEIGGDIRVTKEILDCTFRTHASLLTPQGRLIGGETYVMSGVEAKSIGNEAGQKTVIHLCSDVEISSVYLKLNKNLESHDKAISLLERHLGPFAKNPERIQLLNPPQRAKMDNFWSKLGAVQGSRRKLLETKSGMLEQAKSNDVMRVNFHSKMHCGVVVVAGESVFAPKEDLVGPASLDYILAKKSFELGELKPLGTAG